MTVAMHKSTIILAFLFSCIAMAGRLNAADTLPAAPIDPPEAMEAGVKISLFAAEPDIVTPIGATVDARGRLFVVESNSHFRPKKYQGPTTDRILMLQDTTGTGKADKITTVFEGQNFLMNIVADREGSIVVSSRNEIFRIVPGDNGIANKKITLAHLETQSDYPHNGLHGLALGNDGTIYIGIGENLGGAWTLVGSDDSIISNNTGSGAVLRMDSKGGGLTRIARGFWNPFGLGLDPNGTLWAVDNDPDGRPPSRLIDVAPGGDYGFQFRYGRTGMHPLQAWDGELPGTLGMVAGVGEAPCAVQWAHGRLFVSSWRDHEVQSFILTPQGASYTAAMQPIVRGGDSFRPTGLAFAPDGSLFVNDWASSSYPVHGKGRIWKVTFGSAADAAPPVNDARKRAARLRESRDVWELIAALDDVDPAAAQAAQFGLSRLLATEQIEWSSLKTSRQKIGLLAALLLRGSDLESIVTAALADDNDLVRQMAVRCITEQGIKFARSDLDRFLQSQTLSPRLLGMTVAAINQLDGDSSAKVDSAKINAVLLARMNAPDATDGTRASALQMMQASHPAMALDELGKMLQSRSVALQIEAARYLAADSDPGRFAMLAKFAADAGVDSSVRAECIVGLAADPARNVQLLCDLTADPNLAVRSEAFRALRPIGSTLTAARRQQLQTAAGKNLVDSDLVARVTGTPSQPSRPAETDEAAWQKIVAAAPGDPDAGRRIFFHPSGPGCFRCHMLEGRGRAIGPDLTMIGHSQTSEHVLESILEPSREIAPLFTMWTITTKSGQRLDGMLLRRDGQSNEIYVDASGKETHVVESTVVDRFMRKESLMPAGLVQAMTDQELRDVIALLMQKR